MELKEICWDKALKVAIWKKGKINPDYSPNVLRWDAKGRIMMWSKFQRTDSIFGWNIVPIDPELPIDPEDLDNLHPVNTWYSDQS